MQLSSQLLFFLSALGAFNGLLLSFYFWFARSDSLSNRFLAALLMAISVRIGKSVWFYFNPEISKAFLQIGLTACFLIGPLLYFYCASEAKKAQSLPVAWKAQLMVLATIIIGFGLAFPYQEYQQLWGTTVYQLINWSWLGFLLLSIPFVVPITQKLIERLALTQPEVMLLSVFSGTALIWLAYFTSSYTSYIVGALSFSFILYLIVVLFLFRWKNNKSEKYKDKKIATSQANQMIEQLEQMMLRQKLYQDANLSLPQLAKKMAMSVPQLSQLLNDNLNKPFNLYVNEFRIEAAKELLLAEKKLKMETIAELCGYNSQSTFYTAFKKIENTTPAKFRQSPP